MPLESPNLDDRDFDQLMAEARRRIEQTDAEWTDFSPANPGMTLLELFAHLTETMIYRLNRVPEKVYVEFLRLIGVQLRPPTAASASLTFRRSSEEARRIDIPQGTRVAAERGDGDGDPPVFSTARRAVLGPDEQEVEVQAHHGTRIEGELVGVGTGLPGLSVEVQHAPIVVPTGEETNLVIGVEAEADELEDQAPVLRYGGEAFRIWEETDTFANLGPDRHAYVADRSAGTITFAPAVRMRREDEGLEDRPRALAAIPQAGREIRAWYWQGGGPDGNVPADALTVLKDAVQDVEVTNPAPASGGRAAESLENALERGPQELHSLNRAVTARDFELVAQQNSQAVDRAKAITQAALWQHGRRGTVNVLLVPRPREEDRGTPAVTPALLHERETESVRAQVEQAFEQRRPLGTTCLVQWARYKTIHVHARIVVHREEDPPAIEQRVLERFYQTISPVPTDASSGWPFGQTIRVSHIYEIALEEPGVLWVDQVRLQMDEVPDRNVEAVAIDHFQPNTWYAGCASTLYRSLNDGEGWEPAGRFPDEDIKQVQAHPDLPGTLAVVTRKNENDQWLIHVSRDCGETWASTVPSIAFEVEDVAWTEREDAPVLLLATDEGLYELAIQPDGTPVQVLVDSQQQDLGFYAVVASQNLRGEVSVAVAAQETEGVYLSSDGGQDNTFRHIGLDGEDLRTLAIQYDGPRSFLWAGAAAAGAEDSGQGCFRWELLGREDPPGGWQAYGEGWQGGSCLSLAFLHGRVLAASYRSGVLRLDLSQSSPSWQAPDVECGLPLRDPGQFRPVETIAAREDAGRVMAGVSDGIFRSDDEGTTYQSTSSREFTEKVTLPDTWLFCSGTHQITVVSEDEAERD